jgi:hypothetical protein
MTKEGRVLLGCALVVAAAVIAVLLPRSGSDGDPGGGAELSRSGSSFPETLTPEQQETVERLRSIGYVSGTQPARQGPTVPVHDEARSYNGINLFTSGHAPVAILMDMRGNVLHRWECEFSRAWPHQRVSESNTNKNFFRRAHLFENGDLIVIFEGLGILKLDHASRILWSSRVRAHHDLQAMPNGDLYVLTRRAHVVPRVHETEPILEDFITVMNADGDVREEISLLECVERSAYASLWEKSPIKTGDIFHTNTLEVLDGAGAERAPWLRAGNVLISIRKLDAVAVLDWDRQDVVQAWVGDFKEQHDPKLLENGNILLFDNCGRPNRSRVVEFDPLTFETEWEYSGTGTRPLHSRSCGTAERLPNGNTLITESDNGRAVEVTAGGEVVWEFHNPHRVGPDGETIATLFEVIRLPGDFPLHWAQDVGRKGNGQGAGERRLSAPRAPGLIGMPR